MVVILLAHLAPSNSYMCRSRREMVCLLLLMPLRPDVIYHCINSLSHFPCHPIVLYHYFYYRADLIILIHATQGALMHSQFYSMLIAIA